MCFLLGVVLAVDLQLSNSSNSQCLNWKFKRREQKERQIQLHIWMTEVCHLKRATSSFNRTCSSFFFFSFFFLFTSNSFWFWACRFVLHSNLIVSIPLPPQRKILKVELFKLVFIKSKGNCTLTIEALRSRSVARPTLCSVTCGPRNICSSLNKSGLSWSFPWEP